VRRHGAPTKLAESWNKITRSKLPPTFERANWEWLAKRTALAASTLVTYVHALKYLNTSLRRNLICEIEARDVATYQKARVAGGPAGASINKEFTVLASIFSDQRRWAEIRRDLQRLDQNESAGHALLPNAEARLLQASSQAGLKQEPRSPVCTVTVLGLKTGVQRSEVRKQCWADVEPENRVLVVGKTKTEPVAEDRCASHRLHGRDMWASRFPNRSLPLTSFPPARTATWPVQSIAY
jgi:integrase